MSSAPWVVSVAIGDPRFRRGADRLGESLRRVGFEGTFKAWSTLPPGCPQRLDVPFAFKPYCLAEARAAGAERVLWLDSSCVAIRPLDRLFDEVQRAGYLLFRNWRFILGEWAGDAALQRFGVPRDEAMRIPEVNACALGLDFRHPAGIAFFDRWLGEARQRIAFVGTENPIADVDDYAAVKWNRGQRVSADPRVRGHRHDQTVAGLLAYRLGMRLTTHGLNVQPRVPRISSPRTVLVNLRPARRRRPALARKLRRQAR
jgi:hypothetical protein